MVSIGAEACGGVIAQEWPPAPEEKVVWRGCRGPGGLEGEIVACLRVRRVFPPGSVLEARFPGMWYQCPGVTSASAYRNPNVARREQCCGSVQYAA